MSSSWVLLDVFLVTVLPVLVLQAGFIDLKYRIFTFGAFFCISLISIIYRRITPKMLGFRFDNWKKAALAFAFVSIMAILCLFLVSSAIPLKWVLSPNISSVLTPWQYLLISVPVQQFIYFGYLNGLLQTKTKNSLLIAIIIGFSFALMHVPWQNLLLTILLAIAGIAWGYIYTRTPNLPVSILTHVFLGGILWFFLH